MNVHGVPTRSIWWDHDSGAIGIIDQTKLPHDFVTTQLHTLEQTAEAIATMRVRGAPLIGACAALGMALALRVDPSSQSEARAAQQLLEARPTAVNLSWAIDRIRNALRGVPATERTEAALREALAICDEDVVTCEAIGANGLTLLERHWREKQRTSASPLQVLTHCNAGWLATVDWGTALAPVYKAHGAGIPIHVWVDETRPRNQGSSLTAWELAEHGVPHTLIVDNAGGHLMQHDMVDVCLVGSDRTTARGDVCNKIGTYLKALAAFDNHIPFYVALPVSSIDWEMRDGLAEIPIEQRDAHEVCEVQGLAEHGSIETVRIAPAQSPASNFAFDVTPARLVTALITEHGVFEANEESLQELRAKAF